MLFPLITRLRNRLVPSAVHLRIPVLGTAASNDEQYTAKQVLIRLIKAEDPQFLESQLTTEFNSLNIDSFDLISLRAKLEHHFNVTITDEAWTRINRPSDILLLLNKVRPKSASAASGAFERRTYTLNMPQMALRGLSESWLCKEAGDIHWSIITTQLRTPSSRLNDSTGSRLYATFSRLRLEASEPLTSFRENEAISMEASTTRNGAGMFFSDCLLSGDGRTVRINLMTSFSKFGESGANTSLLKGQPDIPTDCSIPDMSEMPAFGKEYREQRLLSPTGHIFECEYEILPPYDINGVGLLYFAAYPMINDICASQYAGRTITTDFSTVRRDVYYFANSAPDETLIFRIHQYTADEDDADMACSLSRKSDGVRMAHIVTRKVRTGATLPNAANASAVPAHI